MARISLKFYRCRQDSQEYGSDDQHMASRLFFEILVDGMLAARTHADIKQTAGADYETGPIEVGAPAKYRGAWNQVAFAEAATKYFRSLVGSAGGAIHVEGGARIRMKENEFLCEGEFSFDTGETAGGW